MIYIQQEITEFIYSNIVSTVPDYNDATPYLLGDIVRVGSYHYKSLYGTVTLPNTGNDPLLNIDTAWFEYEPSNIYACLDSLEETKTTWSADGIAEFARGQKNTIGIGNFTANSVTIEYRDALDNILDSDTYTFSSNDFVTDEWEYGYAAFASSEDAVIYKPLKLLGTKIRVIFQNSGDATDCGFLIAGKAIYMGGTLDQVSFPDKRIGTRTVGVANFNTLVNDNYLTVKIKEAKKLINESMLFVVDESENSRHGNMVFLGKINKVDGTAQVGTKNQISWEIEQNILI